MMRQQRVNLKPTIDEGKVKEIMEPDIKELKEFKLEVPAMISKAIEDLYKDFSERVT